MPTGSSTTPPHHQPPGGNNRSGGNACGGGFVAPPQSASPLLLFQAIQQPQPTHNPPAPPAISAASFQRPPTAPSSISTTHTGRPEAAAAVAVAGPVPVMPLPQRPPHAQQPYASPVRRPSPLRREQQQQLDQQQQESEQQPQPVAPPLSLTSLLSPGRPNAPTTWRVDTFCRVKPEFAGAATNLGPHVHHIPFELRNGQGAHGIDPPYRTLRLALLPAGMGNTRRLEGMDFGFTEVFSPEVDQAAVYDRVARSVVDSVLQGYNGTIFAYGQTGSGKTFTMTGGETFAERGLIPRAISDVYRSINDRPDRRFRVLISYMEIYNECVYDLLDVGTRNKPLEEWTKIMMMDDEEGEMHLRNLKLYEATTEEDALNLLFLGNWNRITSETPMNEASTRSHCIFTIRISSDPLLPSLVGGKPSKSLFGKLNLVDLAGSERMYKTDTQTQAKTRIEGRYINLSLHYLVQVIVALMEKARRNEDRGNGGNGTPRSNGSGTPRSLRGGGGGSLGGSGSGHCHIPYRNSVMTSILRDSLGGNCRTVFVVTLNTEMDHLEETISTCRFAQRCAQLSTDVLANEEVDPDQLAELLKAEVMTLRAKVAKQEKSLGEASKRLQAFEDAAIVRAVTPAELKLCQEVVRDFLHAHAGIDGGDGHQHEPQPSHPTLAWAYRLDRALVAQCCLLLRRQGREALKLAEEITAVRAQMEERLRLTLAATSRLQLEAQQVAQGGNSNSNNNAATASAAPDSQQPQQQQVGGSGGRVGWMEATSACALLENGGTATTRRTITALEEAGSETGRQAVGSPPPSLPHSFASPLPPTAGAVPLVGKEAVPGQTVLITTHYRSRTSLDESAAAGLLRLAAAPGKGEGGSSSLAPPAPVVVAAGAKKEGQQELEALLQPLAASMLKEAGHRGVVRRGVAVPSGRIVAEEEGDEGEEAERKQHTRLLTEGQAFYKLGRGGRKHARFVWASADLSTIFWRKASRPHPMAAGGKNKEEDSFASSSSSLSLGDCQRVAPGKETGGSHSSTGGGAGSSSGQNDACLTLYSGDRYVTFEVVDPVTRAPEQERRIRDAWVRALAFALQRSQRRRQLQQQQLQQQLRRSPPLPSGGMQGPARSLSQPAPKAAAMPSAPASSSLSPPRIRGGGGSSSSGISSSPNKEGHYPIYPPVSLPASSQHKPQLPRHQQSTAARRASTAATATTSNNGRSRAAVASSSSSSAPPPADHYYAAAMPVDRHHQPTTKPRAARTPSPPPPAGPKPRSTPQQYQHQHHFDHLPTGAGHVRGSSSGSGGNGGYYPIYPPVPLHHARGSGKPSVAFAEESYHRRPPPALGPEDLARRALSPPTPEEGYASRRGRRGRGFEVEEQDGVGGGGRGHHASSSSSSSLSPPRRGGGAGEGPGSYSQAYLSSPKRVKAAGAGAGGYATAQHFDAYHRAGAGDGHFARAVAGRHGGELRGHTDYDVGDVGFSADAASPPLQRRGSTGVAACSEVLRPGRYSTYHQQERRPFY